MFATGDDGLALGCRLLKLWEKVFPEINQMQLLALWPKLPKMAIVIDLLVATNGNYLLYDRSCQKWQFFIDLIVATNGNYLPHHTSCQKWQLLLTSKLPKTVTTCFTAEVAKSGYKWLHIIAKNGNKQNDLQLYRELKSRFCHFWQYFAFSSVIMLSKNCQKWQFLLTSKLPKMANEHTWSHNYATEKMVQFSHFFLMSVYSLRWLTQFTLF